MLNLRFAIVGNRNFLKFPVANSGPKTAHNAWERADFCFLPVPKFDLGDGPYKFLVDICDNPVTNASFEFVKDIAIWFLHITLQNAHYPSVKWLQLMTPCCPYRLRLADEFFTTLNRNTQDFYCLTVITFGD